MACKVSALNNLYPTDCPVLRQVRQAYADWSAIVDKKLRYIRYYRRIDGVQVMEYEHHLVARAAYGDVPCGYHIHHVNEQRTDNRAANLQVLSPAEHAKQHIDGHFELLGRKRGSALCREYVTIHCANCGAPLRRLASRVKPRNFCNPACQYAGTRTVVRPTSEELSDLLKTSTWLAIGRQFGVSDNAVRKWARQYGLIEHPRQELNPQPDL